jgi:hypothetical protein
MIVVLRLGSVPPLPSLSLPCHLFRAIIIVGVGLKILDLFLL